MAQGPSGLVCETFGHHVFRHLFFPHPRPNLGSEALSVMWCFYYTCVANYASCFWFLNYFVNNELVVWQFGGYERTWYLWWKPSFLIYSLRQYFWMMHGGGALAKQYGQQLRVQYPLWCSIPSIPLSTFVVAHISLRHRCHIKLNQPHIPHPSKITWSQMHKWLFWCEP